MVSAPSEQIVWTGMAVALLALRNPVTTAVHARGSFSASVVNAPTDSERRQMSQRVTLKFGRASVLSPGREQTIAAQSRPRQAHGAVMSVDDRLRACARAVVT